MACTSATAAAVRGGDSSSSSASLNLAGSRTATGPPPRPPYADPDNPPEAAPADADASGAKKKRKRDATPAKAAKAPKAAGGGGGLARILQLALAVERSPSEPVSKELVIHCEDLIKFASSPSLPPLGATLLCEYAVGMYRVKFARVWPYAKQLVLALARTAGGALASPPRPLQREMGSILAPPDAAAEAADGDEAAAEVRRRAPSWRGLLAASTARSARR